LRPPQTNSLRHQNSDHRKLTVCATKTPELNDIERLVGYAQRFVCWCVTRSGWCVRRLRVATCVTVCAGCAWRRVLLCAGCAWRRVLVR
ncbi:MAG: hypothetical protein ACPGWR_19015, partial [Ardenticatenaceae bacterium]